MPASYRYRLNGGEIVKKDPKGRTLTGAPGGNLPPNDIWGEFRDDDVGLVMTDGPDIRQDNGDGTIGPLRVLGFAQIYLPGTTTMRLATQPEIDAFAQAEIDQKKADNTALAKAFEGNPVLKRQFMGLIRLFHQDIKQLRRKCNALAVANNDTVQAFRVLDNFGNLNQARQDEMNAATATVAANLLEDETVNDVKQAWLDIINPDDD